MTRRDAERLGAFWEESQSFIQPTEFILKDGKVAASTYSSSPVGRIRAGDAVTLIQMLSKAQG